MGARETPPVPRVCSGRGVGLIHPPELPAPQFPLFHKVLTKADMTDLGMDRRAGLCLTLVAMLVERGRAMARRLFPASVRQPPASGQTVTF